MDTRTPETPLASGAEKRPKPSRGKTIRRFIIMLVALVLVGGALYGFNEFRKQAIANYFASNVPPPTPVAAAKATAEAMPRYLEGIGSLAAVHQVTLAPQLAGRVTKIMFDSGAEVKSGDQVIQLDDAVEQGDLLNFQAQARLAERQPHAQPRARAQRLRDPGDARPVPEPARPGARHDRQDRGADRPEAHPGAVRRRARRAPDRPRPVSSRPARRS